MDTTVYVICLVGCFIVQLLVSLKARWVAIRWIPAAVVVLLMLVSWILYAIGGRTNWAWLILVLLEAGLLVPIALAAVLAGIVRKVKNNTAM